MSREPTCNLQPPFKKSGNLGREWARAQIWDRLGREPGWKKMRVRPFNDPIIERAPTVAPGVHAFGKWAIH